MQFRSDVNGLRAVAALSIVLFHISPSAISGGFVGVDVFYVISGFLITSIIRRDMEQGQFSLLSFYARRARRLFPALYTMMAFVLVIGFFLLLPREMENLAGALISSTFYVSNFYFLAHTGYFDTAAEASPLLHTWSLS